MFCNKMWNSLVYENMDEVIYSVVALALKELPLERVVPSIRKKS